MIVGILSDSHGRCEPVRRALNLFDQAGAEYLIHCGDVGGMDVFDLLAGRACTYVWGNCDDPDPALERYVAGLGLPLPAAVPVVLTLAARTLAVFHGHERPFLSALHRPSTDYVLHGHSHVRRDERVGTARVINPGALHRARPPSVATLDLARDVLAFHELPS
ncbi:MAG: YfcE family phosphodiesterase [Phycisphaerales bacterium]|nr:MAG: YfcE family phosphodiesterase [Phycisphaerales bacterium]